MRSHDASVGFLLTFLLALWWHPVVDAFLYSQQRACPVRLSSLKCNKLVVPKTRLLGVLSRSDIIRASKRRRSQRGGGSRTQESYRYEVPPTLSATIEEALARQEQIRYNLEMERQKSSALSKDDNQKIDDTVTDEKELRRQSAIQERLGKLDSTCKQLIVLRERLELASVQNSNNEKTREAVEQSVRLELVEMGFEALLNRQSTKNWISRKDKEKEFGRPNGFSGLVFQSPNGVPILVGQMGAHADEILRRVGQGSDLWFQVEGYEGSRVLLRTSLCRGYRDSKACVQMAADLAAYYSISRWEQQTVDVMYTDSKHVAKRGSKTGQLRKRKTFGRIVARPSSVQEIAKGKEP